MRGPLRFNSKLESGGANVGGLRALLARLGLVLDARALGEAAEALGHDFLNACELDTLSIVLQSTTSFFSDSDVDTMDFLRCCPRPSHANFLAFL